jgi:PAS domain S-box-containing protein
MNDSEDRYRTMLDAIPTMAWSALPDGSVEFANQRWFDYTGLSREEARSAGWKAAIHADDLETMMSKGQAMLASGHTGDIEVRLRRRDGEYRWFLIRAEPVRNEQGDVVKWYGTNTDIEDRSGLSRYWLPKSGPWK